MKKIKPYNGTITTTQLNPGKITSVELPKRAQVLGVHFDPTYSQVWLSVVSAYSESETWEIRRFITLSGGARLPHNEGALTQVGQPLHDMAATWHVFEIDSPEGRPEARVSAMRGAVVANTADNVAPGAAVVQAGSIRGGLHDRAVSIQ